MRKFILWLLQSIAVFAFVAFAYLAGAVSHEKDIQRECAENGVSGYSAWLGELKCEQ